MDFSLYKLRTRGNSNLLSGFHRGYSVLVVLVFGGGGNIISQMFFVFLIFSAKFGPESFGIATFILGRY